MRNASISSALALGIKPWSACPPHLIFKLRPQSSSHEQRPCANIVNIGECEEPSLVAKQITPTTIQLVPTLMYA